MLASSTVARAQSAAPPAASAAPSANAAAEALIRDGVALRKQRREAEALAKFTQAYALAPTAKAAAQMGLTERALGQWEPAERHLSLALGYDEDEWIRKNRDALDQSLRSVQRHLGWLSVEVDEPGTTLVQAGHEPEPLPLKEPLRVAAGVVKYSLRNGRGQPMLDAEALITAGEVTHRRHVFGLQTPRAPEAPVVFGESVEQSQASTRLGNPTGVLIMQNGPATKEAPAPAPPAASVVMADEYMAAKSRIARERTAAYGATAVAFASFVTTGVFGGLTIDSKSKLSEGCRNHGDCGDNPDFDENTRAHSYAAAATAFLLVGLAASGAATYFFIKAQNDEKALPQVSLRPTPRGFVLTF